MNFKNRCTHLRNLDTKAMEIQQKEKYLTIRKQTNKHIHQNTQIPPYALNTYDLQPRPGSVVV